MKAKASIEEASLSSYRYARKNSSSSIHPCQGKMRSRKCLSLFMPEKSELLHFPLKRKKMKPNAVHIWPRAVLFQHALLKESKKKRVSFCDEDDPVEKADKDSCVTKSHIESMRQSNVCDEVSKAGDKAKEEEKEKEFAHESSDHEYEAAMPKLSSEVLFEAALRPYLPKRSSLVAYETTLPHIKSDIEDSDQILLLVDSWSLKLLLFLAFELWVIFPIIFALRFAGGLLAAPMKPCLLLAMAICVVG